MVKNVLVTIFTICATIIVFLLALIFTRQIITDGKIVVDHSGANPSSITIEIDKQTEKKLVPYGLADAEDETNEIEVKYRIYVTGLSNKHILVTNLESVIVNNNHELSHLFMIIFPKQQEISKLDYFTVKIRMNKPLNQEEYELISDAEVRITLSFKIEKLS